MTTETLTGVPRISLFGRVRRFLFRVAASLLVTAAVLALIGYETRLVRSDGIFAYPLVAALDEVGASIQSTEIGVSALVRRGPEPTMGELKVMAERIVGRTARGADVDFWSEVQPDYRVVYYRGSDPAGGTWIASARYVHGSLDEVGRVEVAYRRDLIGRYDDVRRSLRDMTNRLRYASGLPLADVASDVRIFARPGELNQSDRLITELMSAVDARPATHVRTADELVASAYSPRITGVRPVQGGDVNVMVRIAAHGQGQRIEIGAPALF